MKQMALWKIAAVQMDCKLADRAANLENMINRLRESAKEKAKLAIFPECALSGYCFDSKEDARPHAEPIPGPATVAIAAECRRLGSWAAIGMLETSGPNLFNACALIGPDGAVASYRKIHLPFLGVDRFT